MMVNAILKYERWRIRIVKIIIRMLYISGCF